MLSLILYFFEILPFLGYIKTQSFPLPLSEEEEKTILNRLVNKDKDARDILIKHNLRLVCHLAKKYENYQYQQDDLISVGTIGLMKAIDTYDDSKGNRLTTYASKCFENEILMYIRSNKKHQSNISLQDTIGYDKDGNEVHLDEVLLQTTKIFHLK